MFFIYKIINVTTGKFYVGSTNNPKRRKKDHLVKLRVNKHDNIYLQRAWNKYGSSSFKWKTLDYVLNTEKTMLDVEQKLLNKFWGSGLLYNINPIADKPPVSHKQKQAVSKYMKSRTGKKNPMFGTKRPDIAELCRKRAKPFKLISPTGRVISGINLSKFARDNGLSQQLLHAVINDKRNHHKGWRKG